MKMDTGKLKAWMGRGKGGGAAPPAAKPAAMPPRKGPPSASRGPGGAGAPADPTEDQPDTMSAEGDEPMASEERYYPIMEWLEESGPMLEDATQGMDVAGLLDEESELDPGTADAITMLVPQLPAELIDGMTELAEEATFEDCMAVGAHMQREGWVMDGDVVGGLLHRLFTVLAAPAPQAPALAPAAPPGPAPAPGAPPVPR